MAIIILIVLSILILPRGIADIFSNYATEKIERWQQRGQLPNPSELKSVDSALAVASALDGHRPAIVVAQGDLHTWRASQKAIWDPNTKKHNRQALKYYRKHVILRPTWPRTWASIATIKFRLLEVDKEYFNAIEQAVKFGPNEIPVQLSVAKVGLATWTLLPDTTRIAVLDTVQRGLHHQARYIIRLAIQFGRDNIIMPYIQKNDSLLVMYKREKAVYAKPKKTI
ncbi:MAG: hypothetical protein GXP09_08690 [Gammaproteobacteria bacterium]|nr:hypothetical protein [Gammaproteobacteria bacterium]